jgi:hypothetical protein
MRQSPCGFGRVEIVMASEMLCALKSSLPLLEGPDCAGAWIVRSSLKQTLLGTIGMSG